MADSFFLPSEVFPNIVREFRTDPVTGETAVIIHEDTTALFARNAAERRDNPKGYFGGEKQTFSDDWRTVARLPLVLVNRIKEETGIDLIGMQGQDIDPDQWNYIAKTYLNNSEFSACRTSEGKV